MAKQLNVNLAFTADTSRAKQQIAQLQQQLNNISMASSSGKFSGMEQELLKAQNAAMNLKIALQGAFNVDTGKLDLSKFNQTLKSSNTDLIQIKNQLSGLGATGEQAFMSLAQSIMTAEIPAKRISNSILQLGTTLKNTMRWQISSSVLQGFMKSISSAYNYAQDLNESLNNIRIVTSASTEEMGRLAERANKAAKALSTSTLAYTNASLIYYQQGLNDQQVSERADVTLKLANVTRTNAETVSEWMTAIWNNFDDGSASLEHYADVLTKLGADTASSADEIAGGLEKFAAVSKTVGLDYENAAAALATITATTRQSEDVVGTALKTIFARIESLNLGETLEDGTTLGKYSEALQEVGINIKDANGQLKDMNDIIDETGKKWQDLNRDEQIALAQNVAGIRQYNQFIALMDNYDFYQENLKNAQNATGALAEQNDIYAESWEAAANRVKASAERIYNDLLDDNFFIGMLNGVEGILDLFGDLIDSIGGVSGLLTGLSAILLRAFGQQAAKGLENLVYNMRSFLGLTQQEALASKNLIASLSKDLGQAGADPVTMAQSAAMREKLQLQEMILGKSEQLSEIEKLQTKIILEQNQALGDQLVRYRQEAELAGESFNKTMGNANFTKKSASVSTVANTLYGKGSENNNKILQDIINKTLQLDNINDKTSINYMQKLSSINKKRQELINLLIEEAGVEENSAKKIINSLIDREVATRKADMAEENLRKNTENSKKTIESYGRSQITLSQAIVNTAQGLSSLTFAISSLKGIWDTLNNPDLSAWDKILNVTMSLSMAIPMLITMWQSFKTVLDKDTIARGLNAVATWAQKKAIDAKNRSSNIEQKEMGETSVKTEKDTIERVVNGQVVKRTKGKNGKYIYNTQTAEGGWGFSNKSDIDGFENPTLKDSFKTFGKSIPKMLSAAAPLAIALASIAVIIGSIGLAIKVYNKEANEAAKATEEYKKATENFNNAYEAYNNFKSSLSGFEEAKKGLEGLTKGTQEFRDAVIEANQKAFELINTYEDLQWYYDESGLIQIDENSLAAVRGAEYNKVLMSERVMTASNARMLKEQNEADTVAFNRKYAKDKSVFEDEGAEGIAAAGGLIGGGIGAGLGLATGIAAANFWNPVGWVLAATGVITAITAGVVAAVDNDNTKEEEEAITKLTEEFLQNPELAKSDEALKEAIDKATEGNTSLANSLKENIGETRKLISSLAHNAETIRNLKTQEMMSYLQTNLQGVARTLFESSKYQEEASRILGNSDKTRDEKFMSEKLKNLNDKELAELYVSMMGGNVKDMNYKGGWGKGTFMLNGKEVNMEDDDMRNAIKAEYANQQAANLIEETLANLNTIASKANNLSNLTEESQNYVSNSLASFYSGELDAFNSLTKEELIALKNQNIKITEEMASAVGITSQEFSEKLYNAINNALNLPEIDRETNRLKMEEAELNSLYAGLATEVGSTKEAVEGYTEALYQNNKAQFANKKAAAEAAAINIKFAKGLELLKEALDDNAEALFQTGEKGYDYYEAIGKVQTALKSVFGVEVSQEYVKTYLKDIQKLANGSTESLEKLQKAAVVDVIDNLSIADEYKKEINNFFDDLENRDLSINANFNSESALSGMNELLEAGHLTVDQLQGMLNTLGYSADIGYTYADGPETETTTTGTFTFGDGKAVGYTSTAVSKSKMQVPYIKTDKEHADEDGKVIKAKGTGITQVTTPKLMGGAITGKTKKAGQESDKSKKKLDEEIDRYHELKEAIDDVSRELDQLSTAKDRAFGKDKLKYMDAEIEKMEEQIALQDELASRMELDLTKDQAELNRWGFSTDASGRISNYEEVYAQRLAEYNSLMMTDKDTADEKWEEFEKAVEQYEETLNGLEDAQAEAINLRYELEEKRLENIQTIVEDNIELTNDKLATLEYQMSKIEDDAFAAADAIALIGQQTDAAVENLKHYESGIREVLKMETANGSRMTDEEVDRLLKGDTSVLQGKELTSNQIEALREYRDNIYETNQELQEYVDSINEKVVEYFEAANEKLERQGELLERNQKILENYRNIIDLVGADNLGISSEVISRMNQQMVKNADATLQHARIMRDQTKAAYEEAAAAGILSEEELNTLYDAYLDAEENFNDSWVSALEAASEAFENEVQRILDNFDKALGGLEEKLDWFEKLQERNEIFYKDYEKTYEISKLNRQIAESIDTTDNLRGQRALTEIQRELLKYQEQGKELSKYDLEYLQKKYDLELARIALEEAQNAKSQVRLTRDSAGNYGYMYTADANAVANAEQTYEDKLYELEKFLDESETAIQKQILSWNKEMMEALGALDQSAEDYDEQAKNVVDHYMSLINSLSDEGQEILQRGKEMNEEYGTHAAEVFNETIMGKLYTDINSYQEFNAGMQEAISTTLKDLEDNHSNYQQNVSDIFDTAGQDIEDFKDDVVEYLGEVDQANKDILETTGSMAQEMDSDFDAIVDVAKTFQQRYDSMIRPLIELNEDVADSITGLIAAYEALDDPTVQAAVQSALDKMSEGANDKAIAAEQNGNIFDDNTGYVPPDPIEHDPRYDREEQRNQEDWNKVQSNTSKTKDPYPDSKFKIGSTVQASSKAGSDGVVMKYFDNNGEMSADWPIGYLKLQGKKVIDVKKIDGTYYYALEGIKTSANNVAWFSGYQLDFYDSFDTGGYTGAWGPEGRLAMLHQKELVLNAQDTENFLTAIQIVRSMADQLEANARAAQYGMTEIRAAAGLSQQGTLEQNVHIEASFPNATNHSEIEEAFGNLVNLAAQYANRK